MLVHGLQKDLQSQTPSHHSEEFDNFNFQVASTGCRHLQGFFLADAPVLLSLLDRKINFLKILNKQQASHSSSEFYKIKYLC